MRSRQLMTAALGACLFTAAAVPASAAATATVEGGVLTVRGDGANDQVAIARSPADPSKVRVEALVTLVNGSGFDDFSGVKSVDVDLGDGADLLRIGSTGLTRMTLGGIAVADANGVLDVGILNAVVKGEVRIICGDGADKVDFANVTVAKSVTVETDERASVTGGLDTFGLTNSQIGGDFDLWCGAAKDTVTITSTTGSPGTPTRLKRATLFLSSGDDFLSFTNSEVTSSLVVHGGAGNDVVGLLYLAALGTPAPKLKSLELDFAEGASSVALVGSTTVSGTVVGNVLVKGGVGADTNSLINVQVMGAVTATLGEGADQFTLNRCIVKKAVNVELGGGLDQMISTDTVYGNAFACNGGADAGDAARMRAGTRYKLVPVFTGFEVSEGPAVIVAIHDQADQSDRLSVDLALSRFEIFIDGVSTATGSATLAAKGGSVAVTPDGASLFRFTAKLNVAARTGTCTVTDVAGALVLKLFDKDGTF